MYQGVTSVPELAKLKSSTPNFFSKATWVYTPQGSYIYAKKPMIFIFFSVHILPLMKKRSSVIVVTVDARYPFSSAILAVSMARPFSSSSCLWRPKYLIRAN
jgi:hypothetical protein